MRKKTIVWITTSFIAWHRWKDAPAFADYLRVYHRHVFHVKLGVEIVESRQIEFIELKRRVDAHIYVYYSQRYFELSCEDIAVNLMDKFKAEFVEVSEDGENGARVECQLETI